MKEPEIIDIHINVRDDNGNEHWKTVGLALTDELLSVIKDKVEIKAPISQPVNYDKMKLEVYESLFKTRVRPAQHSQNTFEFTERKSDTNRRKIPFKEVHILHPDDVNQALTLIKEYERLEKL